MGSSTTGHGLATALKITEGCWKKGDGLVGIASALRGSPLVLVQGEAADRTTDRIRSGITFGRVWGKQSWSLSRLVSFDEASFLSLSLSPPLSHTHAQKKKNRQAFLGNVFSASSVKAVASESTSPKTSLDSLLATLFFSSFPLPPSPPPTPPGEAKMAQEGNHSKRGHGRLYLLGNPPWEVTSVAPASLQSL